eukprot:351511-Chlamydomonas_euryale.AAC.3
MLHALDAQRGAPTRPVQRVHVHTQQQHEEGEGEEKEEEADKSCTPDQLTTHELSLSLMVSSPPMLSR